ncbi:MAG TPA: DNA internalization-related competence protein ComEC/Rec2 [Methyloradius sp.]
MTYLALMFVFGVWVLQQLPELPNDYWALLLIPCLFLALLFQRISRPYSLFCRNGFLLIAVFAAGFFWASGYAHYRLADALPSDWQGKNIQIIGVVASMPQQLERSDRFEFDVESVLTQNDGRNQAVKVPVHISLAQYSTEFGNNQTLEKPTSLFHAGERWKLTVRLKQPHGTANPHGFDFEMWALERNIRATGYVRKDDGNQKLSNFVMRPKYIVEALRENIRTRMQRVLENQPYEAVLRALAIGDESAITQDDWQVFLKTGTNHLMSISGLHITMLAGLLYGLVYAVWRRVELLTLTIPARKAAVVAGMLTALIYALIAGFSIPTQRTLYMLAVFGFALWQSRSVLITRVLSYALLLVVLIDPWSVLAPGFWLSFGAVAVMSYAAGGRLGRPHWLREAVHVQWAVTLGLIPLLLVLFQQFSIISPVANAVAIPLISLVVVPLTLLGSFLPIDWPLQLAHWIMTLCFEGLQWLAHWPLSTWQQHAPAAWTLPVALMGVVWMLLPRGIPLRWLGLFGLFPMFLLVPASPQSGAMQVSVLDVGQGLAVVVRTKTHTLLYDTGPRYSSQSDSGSRIIVPYLRGEGLAKLDGLVISHNDDDHSGGALSVLSQVPVSWLASSLPATVPELQTAYHLPCYEGQRWQWDGVQFEMVYPDYASYGNASLKDNDRSCVLKVTSQFGSLLLTGDIEAKAEDALLGAQNKLLKSDVLIVPHHGSKTSSTPGFVATVEPAIAIFTVGYLNRFGHPKAQIVDRYEAIGSRIYRSDQDGAILLDFTEKQGIVIRRWRQQAKHYWTAHL